MTDAWVSAPAGPLATTTAGFMCIHNDSAVQLSITGATSSVVATIEIHDIVHNEGVVRMKRRAEIAIPANGKVCLDPEQQHFMLIGIEPAVRAGADVDLQLSTDSGETVNVMLPQRDMIEVR